MARPANRSPQTIAVLTVLAESPEEWRYGYDLSRVTGLKSGTLYPLLIRLSEQGLLDSKWQSPTGPGRPARHVYRIKAAGVGVLAEAAVRPWAPGRPALA